MLITKYYSIQNLINFKIIATKYNFKKIDLEYNYYETLDTSLKLDFVLKINQKIPEFKNKKYKLLYGKYYIGDDFFFTKDNYKVANWKIYIENLFKINPLKIYINGNIFLNLILIKIILEPLIRTTLNFKYKDSFMLHSSCLKINDKAIVFTAGPSTGKTSLILKYLFEGNPFISDEYSIIKDKKVYSYVTPLRLHTHTLKSNPQIIDYLSKEDIFQTKIRTTLLNISNRYIDLTHSVPMQKVFKKNKIETNIDLKSIFVVSRSVNSNELEFIETPINNFIKKIITIDKFEKREFLKYQDIIGYVFPNSIWGNYYEDFYNKLIEYLPNSFYEIIFPSNLNNSHYKKLLEFIKKK